MKKALIISFLRYQVAAIIATMVDFFVLIILTELFNVWYVASTAIGAFCGALTNFIICRYWAFVNSSNNLSNQIVKYTLVSAGSLVLNTLFVYLLTDFGGVTYSISKIITAIFIAIFYNFTLQKYYVFKQ
ncbi:GtrA family protein [Vicingus serpentipes]|uniref:GtrA family protein n=1 Tax=Vicingus serpentipes TaxID=1926625 RepID=A0A5C6RWE7_9FLAO|nr:GtrA family protein [Vicingus serpentipes]TXB65910.1 GtrA family protein [Vicingus serpentipes]